MTITEVCNESYTSREAYFTSYLKASPYADLPFDPSQRTIAVGQVIKHGTWFGQPGDIGEVTGPPVPHFTEHIHGFAMLLSTNSCWIVWLLSFILHS